MSSLSEPRVVWLAWEEGRNSSREERRVGGSLIPEEDHGFPSSLVLFFGWTMAASQICTFYHEKEKQRLPKQSLDVMSIFFYGYK